jgi:hypothetical protein
MNQYKNVCQTKYNTVAWTFLVAAALLYMMLPFYFVFASLWIIVKYTNIPDLLWQTTICFVVGTYIAWFTGRSTLRECNLQDLADEEDLPDLSDEAELA